MSKSNCKVICIILAVFLLFIGAPFFSALGTDIDAAPGTDFRPNAAMAGGPAVTAHGGNVVTAPRAGVTRGGVAAGVGVARGNAASSGFSVTRISVAAAPGAGVMRTSATVALVGFAQEIAAFFAEETMDMGVLVHPVAVQSTVKNQGSQRMRLYWTYLTVFSMVGTALFWMNKSFFPMGRYSDYNHIKYFLMELRILHRADGKYRPGCLYV